MKGEKLVLKARADLNRLTNFQTPIEDEPDSEVKASFILTRLKNDPSNNQNKSKLRTDPGVRAGGKLTTDRRDALQALKIALSEVEEADVMKEDSPPKPIRPLRLRTAAYQENVPPPQVPSQPRVVLHHPPAAALQPQPLVPQVRVYGTGSHAVPAPAPSLPPAVHGNVQPFNFASLVTSIAMHHMQQPQYPANPYPVGPPPAAPPLPSRPPLSPAEFAALADQLQRHIYQYMQVHNGYPMGPASLPIAPPPVPPAVAPPSPATATAMALELQEHIARFMQAHSNYMFPIKAPDMLFPMPHNENWKASRDANGRASKTAVNNGKNFTTSSNTTSFEASKALDKKDSATLHDDFQGKTGGFTSIGRAFGTRLSLNDTHVNGEDGHPSQDNQGRRQSQRKTKKPVRNIDEAFEFKENKMRGSLNVQRNWYEPPKAQASKEIKRGLASTATVPATIAAAAVVPPKINKPKTAPAPDPAPATDPLPAKQARNIYFSEPTTDENNSLANLADDSLEAQIKRKTITAVNIHYWPEMPADIQVMEKEVLDFSKPYTPAGMSYFSAEVKALRGAAMYAAQLEVIEERLAWVVEEMKKEGTLYGWKKGKDPDAGSYEFYRGIALKYLRDRLKSRCRVEAGKRDKDK